MALDEIDYGIIDGLQNNARLSNKELAARVGLSPSSTHARVRRLQRDGVLRAFRAEVDPAALGIGLQAVVTLRLADQSAVACERLRKYLMGLPEVLAVFHLAGEDDLLVHVAVADAEQLRDAVVGTISERPEIRRVNTSLVFDHDRKPTLPNYKLANADRA